MIFSEPTIRVLTSEAAQEGLRAGIVAAVVLAAFEIGRRLAPWVPATSGGLVALAGAVGLQQAGRGSLELTLVVAVLLVGGVGISLVPAPPWTRPLALIPGIAILAAVVEPEVTWMAWLLPVVVLVVGTTAPVVEPSHARSGAGATLLGVAALAIFFAVPDTEHVVVVLLATVPVVAVAWLVGADLGGGAAAAVAVLGTAVGIDGAARPWTIVAALGCLGLLLVQPIARWRTGSTPLDALATSRLKVVPLALFQLGIGVVCARVLVRSPGVPQAVVGVGVVLTTAGVAAHLAAMRAWRAAKA